MIKTVDEVVKGLEQQLFPEEVLRGHRARYIAHKRLNGRVISIVYEYVGTIPVIVTVYVAHADRYYQGGSIHEDKILK